MNADHLSDDRPIRPLGARRYVPAAAIAERDRLKNKRACRGPSTAGRPVATSLRSHELRAAWRECQKAAAAPKSRVLSVEPPVGSCVWSMTNLFCQYT